MKKVGIFTRKEIINNRLYQVISDDLINKLQDKVEIKIIVSNTYKQLIKETEDCDGIIFPGGDDPIKEELQLIRYLHKIDKPVLGICLGMQEMGMAINGTLGKVGDYSHKSQDKYVHNISINENSKLFQILEKKTIKVNSRHQDMVINTKLFIGARSREGIIEEVEDNTKKFFIGVQWHPENLNDNNSKKIFDYFINYL